jgi:hypothetical protein
MPAIWPTVVLSGVCIAAVIGTLLGLCALRRTRRIRRGCCPACAAPVGTTATCAECGSALPAGLRAIWEENRQRRAAAQTKHRDCRKLGIPSLSTPRGREALANADVVLAVDVKTGQESIVYGRRFLKNIHREGVSRGGSIVRVEVHPDLDDLDRLCAAVGELRGHHEYRPPKAVSS